MPIFLASDFGAAGAADFIVVAYIAISVLAIVSLGLSLPKSLKKQGRRMSLVSVTISALFSFGALCLLASSRKLDSGDGLLLGILGLPPLVSVVAVVVSRKNVV